MTTQRLGPWVNGRALDLGKRELDRVTNPATGELLAEVAWAGADDLEQAIVAAEKASAPMKALARHERHAILTAVAARLTRDRESLAKLLTVDAGKPYTQSLGEVDRAAMTFSLAADEARHFTGELVPLDLDPRGKGMTSIVQRYPLGPVSAITPFNFPLNLLAHKVAPAIAIGSTVVMKPPPQCPLMAFRLGEILSECGLPKGAYNVLHMPVALAERLATDERFKVLSFTGSAKVGWHLKNVAGKKRVLLELGGNAAAVVHDDAPDLSWVAERLAFGAFAYAGQVCIKVQRLYVHEAIYDRFTSLFTEATKKIVVGDPLDAKTVVGPMIDEANARRVDSWVDEAIAAGAHALVRGQRKGALLGPTVLTDVPNGAKVQQEEVFGPVVTVAKYNDWSQVLAQVNDSAYGLQAGIFTHDVRRIFSAFDTLDVGGLVVNDFPTLRIDNYPYGGVKDSGLGREGVRYAMQEMSEPRALIMNLAR